MSEIIGVITSVEDDSYDGKDFKKVTLGTGQVLKVKYGREGALKKKWGLLQEDVAIKFIMRDYTTPDGTNKPFVADIETVGGALPPAQSQEQVLPEHQEVIEKAKAQATPPAPQAVGMITKEIGDMIRAKYLKAIFGDEAQTELIKWYRGQTLGITRINYDGAKLPKLNGAEVLKKKGETT